MDRRKFKGILRKFEYFFSNGLRGIWVNKIVRFIFILSILWFKYMEFLGVFE